MKIKIKVKEAKIRHGYVFEEQRKYAVVEITGDREIVEPIKSLIDNEGKDKYNWEIV